MHLRMMILGVVADYNYAFAFMLAPILKKLHEIPESLPIKFIGLTSIYEHTIVKAHRSKIPNSLSSWMMQNDRISILRRNPHTIS